MIVRVEWSDSQVGYTVAYDVPEMYRIDPSEGNSDAAGFYEYPVSSRLEHDLDNLGIGYDLRAF